MVLDRVRMARRRGRADGFVRLLGVLGFVFVNDRLVRQVLGAETLLDGVADFRHRLVGEVHRVGTHVADQADDLAVAQVHALVQRLRRAHGALGGKPEFARGLLLQRRSGERRRRIAPALLLVNRRDLEAAVGGGRERRLDLGRARAVVNGELLDFFRLENRSAWRRIPGPWRRDRPRRSSIRAARISRSPPRARR